MNKIPIFKSHYSIGRSILTLKEEGISKPTEADSIIDICKEYNVGYCLLIEDHIGSILESSKVFEKSNIDFNFGLRLTVCDDINDKSKEGRNSNWKCNIILKDIDGYKNLIKISSKASTEGFYYEPRIDFQSLRELWNNNHFDFIVPFYDSFLFQNVFKLKSVFVDFDFCAPIFFVEDHNIIYDDILKNKILDYCGDNGYLNYEAHSMYYKKKSDFKTYLTNRCIYEKVKLNKPNIDWMTSNEFCAECLK